GDAGRAVAHDVQGAQPQPGPARVQPGLGQGRAGHGEDGGRGAGLCSPAAGGQAVGGASGQRGRGGDRAVGPAVLPKLSYVRAGRRALTGGALGGAHCPASGSSPARGSQRRLDARQASSASSAARSTSRRAYSSIRRNASSSTVPGAGSIVPK